MPADRNVMTRAALNVADFAANLRSDAEKADEPDIGEQRATRAQVRRAFQEGSPDFRRQQVKSMGLDDTVKMAREIHGERNANPR